MISKRLLIVDDEPGITRVIEAAALELGFQVMPINNTAIFEKALAAIKPTVIFLDIVMPDRDGVELIRKLAADKYAGHVVLMSGADPSYIQMGSTIAKARGLNIAATLAKPFRKQDVIKLLTSLQLKPI